MVALKDNIAHQDAPLVRNLTRAGAVVIGRTNTPEFSFRADTDNPLHGRTHNPWGRHVSPGGSSGGAASAVMSGCGALAHGNDIGASLRFPAAATGAVTVKPGLGRVPAYNPSQKAERGMLAQAMSVQGLITRSAADLQLSMPALIAPDIRDPFHVPLPYKGDEINGPVRVAVSKACFGFDLHPEVSKAIDLAADALSDAGYDIEEMTPPLAQETAECGYRALLGEVSELLGPDIRTHGSETINAIFEEYFRQFPPYQGRSLLDAMAKRSFYAREWALFLNEYPNSEYALDNSSAFLNFSGNQVGLWFSIFCTCVSGSLAITFEPSVLCKVLISTPCSFNSLTCSSTDFSATAEFISTFPVVMFILVG